MILSSIVASYSALAVNLRVTCSLASFSLNIPESAMKDVDFELWLEAALFEALGFMPRKGIAAHTPKTVSF